MKIRELVEASRAQQEKQKKAAKLAKLQQTPKPADEPSPRSAYVKKQLKQFELPKQTNQLSSDNQGPFSSSEFDKYKVDDTIDTSFEGGYYLRFIVKDQIYGYFSKNPNLTFDQIRENFPKQTVAIGRTLDTNVVEGLIDKLVQMSGKGGQPGYVHVILDTNIGKFRPIYYKLLEFFLSNYPQDDYTVSSTVGWEDQNR